MLFNFPESVRLEINEEKIYAIVWEDLMQLQEELPRALMYYGKRDENGVENIPANSEFFFRSVILNGKWKKH